MKNYEILALINNGALSITDHTIPTAHAIKVYRFKKSLNALYKKLVEDEGELIKQNSLEIKDGRLDGKPEDLKRFAELQRELYNEDVAIECKTMPYDAWHQLKAENKAIEINGITKDVLTPMEAMLEGVLWEDEGE